MSSSIKDNNRDLIDEIDNFVKELELYFLKNLKKIQSMEDDVVHDWYCDQWINFHEKIMEKAYSGNRKKKIKVGNMLTKVVRVEASKVLDKYDNNIFDKLVIKNKLAKF